MLSVLIHLFYIAHMNGLDKTLYAVVRSKIYHFHVKKKTEHTYTRIFSISLATRSHGNAKG